MSSETVVMVLYFRTLLTLHVAAELEGAVAVHYCLKRLRSVSTTTAQKFAILPFVPRVSTASTPRTEGASSRIRITVTR